MSATTTPRKRLAGLKTVVSDQERKTKLKEARQIFQRKGPKDTAAATPLAAAKTKASRARNDDNNNCRAERLNPRTAAVTSPDTSPSNCGLSHHRPGVPDRSGHAVATSSPAASTKFSATQDAINKAAEHPGLFAPAVSRPGNKGPSMITASSATVPTAAAAATRVSRLLPFPEISQSSQKPAVIDTDEDFESCDEGSSEGTIDIQRETTAAEARNGYGGDSGDISRTEMMQSENTPPRQASPGLGQLQTASCSSAVNSEPRSPRFGCWDRNTPDNTPNDIDEDTAKSGQNPTLCAVKSEELGNSVSRGIKEFSFGHLVAIEAARHLRNQSSQLGAIETQDSAADRRLPPRVPRDSLLGTAVPDSRPPRPLKETAVSTSVSAASNCNNPRPPVAETDFEQPSASFPVTHSGRQAEIRPGTGDHNAIVRRSNSSGELQPPSSHPPPKPQPVSGATATSAARLGSSVPTVPFSSSAVVAQTVRTKPLNGFKSACAEYHFAQGMSCPIARTLDAQPMAVLPGQSNVQSSEASRRVLRIRRRGGQAARQFQTPCAAPSVNDPNNLQRDNNNETKSTMNQVFHDRRQRSGVFGLTKIPDLPVFLPRNISSANSGNCTHGEQQSSSFGEGCVSVAVLPRAGRNGESSSAQSPSWSDPETPGTPDMTRLSHVSLRPAAVDTASSPQQLLLPAAPPFPAISPANPSPSGSLLADESDEDSDRLPTTALRRLRQGVTGTATAQSAKPMNSLPAAKQEAGQPETATEQQAYTSLPSLWAFRGDAGESQSAIALPTPAHQPPPLLPPRSPRTPPPAQHPVISRRPPFKQTVSGGKGEKRLRPPGAVKGGPASSSTSSWSCDPSGQSTGEAGTITSSSEEKPSVEPLTGTTIMRPPPRLTAAKREQKAAEWYARFNAESFDNRLPAGLPIVWNARLRKTAGQAVFVRYNHEVISHQDDSGPGDNALTPPLTPTKTSHKYRVRRIELAPKILREETRLATTLLHECCHVAQRTLDEGADPPHGPLFMKWARRASRCFPEFAVTVRHDFQLDQPHQWKCVNCGMLYRRYSKSIKPEKHRCGVPNCRGQLEYLGAFRPDGTPKTSRGTAAPGQGARTLTPYQRFVKVKYSEAKELCRNNRSEAMRLVAEWWKEERSISQDGGTSLEDVKQCDREAPESQGS